MASIIIIIIAIDSIAIIVIMIVMIVVVLLLLLLLFLLIIIRPRGHGKTLLLRDVARILSSAGRHVLILDGDGEVVRGNHSSSTTCLTQVFFKRGEECSTVWCSLTL